MYRYQDNTYNTEMYAKKTCISDYAYINSIVHVSVVQMLKSIGKTVHFQLTSQYFVLNIYDVGSSPALVHGPGRTFT